MDDAPEGPDCSEFAEVDPTGRYGRYDEILGKGASKTVYRAFDEYEGIEVAWNQVKLYDFLQSPQELERLYCEIHLLKTLKHKNIMKFYTSWVDTSNRNINFVTEMFTSGTLRQYRQKHRRVNIRAVKHWCRQILKGLLYLHSHDPPVIHRDLKCDNIFINGNQGEVKIGDLGLAAILRKSHAAHCVGTPEFMAPEVYEEDYNELVDIYSFGMCILEMVTLEYPYSECTHPVQIYKKVISGTKPEALYKVKDPEVRQFVEKCLASACRRLPARELLQDPFLRVDDGGGGGGDDLGLRDQIDAADFRPISRQPSFDPGYSNGSFVSDGFSGCLPHEAESRLDYDHIGGAQHGMELFSCQEDEPFPNFDITIRGRRRDDGSIFLRLRISEKEGPVRNIYFPFDVETDTALSVATEMVAELDITEYDVTRIAEMIDGEICSLVPEWRPGPGIDDTPAHPIASVCQNCASNVSSIGSLLDYRGNAQGGGGFRCSRLGCGAAVHGRFEEITYQMDDDDDDDGGGGGVGGGSEECVTDQPESGVDVSFRSPPSPCSADRGKPGDQPAKSPEPVARSLTQLCCGSGDPRCSEPIVVSDDYEEEIRQELRWLDAKYQTELRGFKSKHLRDPNSSAPAADLGCRPETTPKNGPQNSPFGRRPRQPVEAMLRSVHLGDRQSPAARRRRRGDHGDVSSSSSSPPAPASSSAYPDGQFYWSAHEANAGGSSAPEAMFPAENFYGGLLPSCLSRTKSLPVDAVDA